MAVQPQIMYNIIFKLMKGKKQRRNMVSKSPNPVLKKKQEGGEAKIKFNLSTDNLRCFMGQKHGLKKCWRKNSQSRQKNRKSENKCQKQALKVGSQKKQSGQKRKVQPSPDISRQLSNTILSCIQKKGLTCPWNDTQQHLPSKDSPNQIFNQEIWSVFSNESKKSYASTNDFHHYQNYNYYNYPLTSVTRHRTDSNVFSIQLDHIRNDFRTTIMIRNIPNKYSINELAEEIDETHSNCYDFLYLPCDFNNQCNVGYGFINFLSTEHLKSFYEKFHNYVWRKYKSEKICALTYARLQGLNQLIEHFENSKVLNQKQKKYRPIIKYDKIHKMVLAQQKR